MAMEKYGTDYNTILPTDGILRAIKRLCEKQHIKYVVPKTMEEALELVTKLGGEYNGEEE